MRAGELFRDVGMPDIAEDDPPTLAELAQAAHLLVAEEDHGQLVGYALCDIVGGQAHLEQLSVLPELGGRGIGTALIEAVVAWARERGDRAVTLTTFRDVPFNAPLYAKRGFVEVPEADWSEELRALVEEEAEHGLDPDLRVVMRRLVT
ncbi:MAG: GNAT family N-acetyltransferase [Actinomycetota bacterium]